MILEINGEEKGAIKAITQRTNDIVEPFNERSIYSIGKFFSGTHWVLELSSSIIKILRLKLKKYQTL